MQSNRYVAGLFSLFSLSLLAADLTTPENALKSLEDAYIRKDVDGAVAAKDFRFEARELSFRKQMTTRGFPDFKGLRCSVVKKTFLAPDLAELKEECVFPDGGKSVDIMHVAKSQIGWRVVVLPPK